MDSTHSKVQSFRSRQAWSLVDSKHSKIGSQLKVKAKILIGNVRRKVHSKLKQQVRHEVLRKANIPQKTPKWKVWSKHSTETCSYESMQGAETTTQAWSPTDSKHSDIHSQIKSMKQTFHWNLMQKYASNSNNKSGMKSNEQKTFQGNLFLRECTVNSNNKSCLNSYGQQTFHKKTCW